MHTLAARTEPLQAMPLQTTFRDGLGTRYLWDGAGGPLEVLTLHSHLGAVSSFESLIQERVARLAQFRQPCYAHVRDVEHDADASRLAVVSDYVPGVRLSRLLATAEQHFLPLDVDSALCLLRQLLSAVATLHEATPDTWHGALAPERIVITPDASLVIVEHVFGAALEQLGWSADRYWTDVRIALPPGGEDRFTRRGDVFQAGTTALGLLLGRPLGDNEYPAGLEELASGTFGLGGGFEPLPQWLGSWLSRALWLDSSQAFTSAADARQTFESGLATSGYDASQAALESFLAQYHSTAGALTELPANAMANEMEETAPAVPAHPVAVADPHTPPPEPPVPATAIHISPNRDEETDVPYTSLGITAAGGNSRKARLIAAAVLLVALTSGGAMAARRYLSAPTAVAAATGTLAIQTSPAGANVVINGQARGVTPLNVSLNAGSYTVELSIDGARRTIPVTIAAQAAVSQFIEMPHAVPVVGQLDVRTDPSGAKVSVDGQRRGVSPLTVTGLEPGSHVVMLENDLGSVSENVTVQPGATASLVVPLRSPQGAPVSGWISITAPAEVQVFENQRLLGSTSMDRIMVATGRHDLEFVNDALGYRSSQTVQVGPGQVAKVKPDWPQGTIAINAAPWANVWLDGRELGETPVGNTQVPIGTHDVVFRHPQLGEQRYTATVTAATPARLSVDMRKK